MRTSCSDMVIVSSLYWFFLLHETRAVRIPSLSGLRKAAPGPALGFGDEDCVALAGGVGRDLGDVQYLHAGQRGAAVVLSPWHEIARTVIGRNLAAESLARH